MNYNALMHAMAAPDIKVELLGGATQRPPQRARGDFDYLALV